MKKFGVTGILDGILNLVAIVIAGGGSLTVIWEKEAQRRGIALYRIDAGEWPNLLRASTNRSI